MKKYLVRGKQGYEIPIDLEESYKIGDKFSIGIYEFEVLKILEVNN